VRSLLIELSAIRRTHDLALGCFHGRDVRIAVTDFVG